MPSVKPNYMVRTEVKKEARRSSQNRNKKEKQREPKLPQKHVCWSLSILQCLMCMFQSQVDDSTELIQRDKVTICQYSAVQSNLLLHY